jgi:hypothetical protein
VAWSSPDVKVTAATPRHRWMRTEAGTVPPLSSRDPPQTLTW